MDRAIAFIGAASNVGIRPYDDGLARYVNRAPEVFRERGLIEKIGAYDVGDVVAQAYRDFTRPVGKPRNEPQVAAFSRALGDRVAAAGASRRLALVIGADCSVVLGGLLGARRLTGDPVGLVYVDAHADFATPEESLTGSAAGMALALATGRGDSPLARLSGLAPLVRPEHVALVGRRDAGDDGGHAALGRSAILDLPDTELLTQDPDAIVDAVLARVAAPGLGGFWVQVDADVINPMAMRAVDSPEPGGPMPHELADLLSPLIRHPRALGFSLTIYDPALDPDRSGARQLIRLLTSVFRDDAQAQVRQVREATDWSLATDLRGRSS